MQHRAWHRLVVGAVLLVFITACASDAPVATVAPVAEVPTQVPATAVATTEVVAVPLPSPTALVIEQPATPAPTDPAEPTVIEPTVAPTATAIPLVEAVPTAAAPAAAPAAPPATAAPVSGSQEVLATNGAEVYTLNCARCHAENGLGTGQYSSPLIGVGSRYSTQAMIDELTNGHPVTFGFADRLSADEIASVVAYVKASFP